MNGYLSPPYPDSELTGVGNRVLSSDFGRDSGFNPAVTSRKTDYLYDRVGNVIGVIDARGVKTSYSVSELNEVWKITRAADTSLAASRLGGCDPTQAEDLSGQAFAYLLKCKHDNNGNIVQVLIQSSGNLPDAGTFAGFLETTVTYDILDNQKTIAREYGQSGEMATWTYLYDENENLVQVTEPEQNAIRYAFDARDLLLSVTRGYGATGASTSTFVYDGNYNRTQLTDGNMHTLIREFDGFDRVRHVTDAVGSERLFTYDPTSNVTLVVEKGKLNGSSANGFELRRTAYAYDERSRPYRIDRSDPQNPLIDGSLTPLDGKVSTRIDFDRLSRRTFLVEDDVQLYTTRFDGSGRVIKTIDPAGNEVANCFDDNDNLVKVTETEKYPNGTSRTFETFDIFDSLNRHVSTTDNIGQTSRFGYDSRDNMVSSSDAQASLSTQTINGRTVNNPGNTRRSYHDGFDRVVQEEMDLRAGGTGDGAIDLSNLYNTDGKVLLVQAWDKNSRLTKQVDDRRKTTRYDYDVLNRLKSQTFADLAYPSTSIAYTYDLADNLATVDDRRGDHVVLGYDSVNRLTTVHCTPGSGVIGTSDLVFEYDGLNRRTKTTDSVNGVLSDTDDWIVTRTFDALSRIKTDTQNGRTVTSTWREESKRTALNYPSGLSVTFTHDALDRISNISTAGASLADYLYAGPERILNRVLTISPLKHLTERRHDGSYNDNAYWDGARRPIKIETLNAMGGLQSGFEHSFDRADNRKFERRLHDSSKGDNYVYDSLYRLTTFEREVPATDVGSPGNGNQQSLKSWKIDGVQNWRELIINGATTSTTVNNVNAYTAFGTAAPIYDLDGNMTSPDQGAMPLTELSTGTRVYRSVWC